MKISLDNGVTYVEIEQVRVIFDDLEVGNLLPAELHINITDEGIITDVWRTDVDANFATQSESAQEIIDRLVQDQD